MKYKALSALCICLLLFASSCKFQKVLKNGTADEKYEQALKLYAEKDYPGHTSIR